jgi:hypothetical protein
MKRCSLNVANRMRLAMWKTSPILSVQSLYFIVSSLPKEVLLCKLFHKILSINIVILMAFNLIIRLRFLRNSDRTLNEHCYPNLFYPELYLLEGGYKLFYEAFKNYCEPQTYKPMLHVEHQTDLKHFRAKTKSWDFTRHHIVYKYHQHLQKQKSSFVPETECEQE